MVHQALLDTSTPWQLWLNSVGHKAKQKNMTMTKGLELVGDVGDGVAGTSDKADSESSKNDYIHI